MKRILPFLATGFLFGCTIGVKSTPPVAVYDFGLPASSLVEPGKWSALALDLTSPAWVESPDVSYRLLHEAPLMRRQYAQSRWAGAPGTLLARHLRQQLGLVSSSENVAVNCRLSIDLQEFSQLFVTPEQARAVLQATVRLIDARHRSLAEQRFQVESPAPSADATGGVQALLVVSRDFGRQLSDWLTALDTKNRLTTCRSAVGG